MCSWIFVCVNVPPCYKQAYGLSTTCSLQEDGAETGFLVLDICARASGMGLDCKKNNNKMTLEFKSHREHLFSLQVSLQVDLQVDSHASLRVIVYTDYRSSPCNQ